MSEEDKFPVLDIKGLEAWEEECPAPSPREENEFTALANALDSVILEEQAKLAPDAITAELFILESRIAKLLTRRADILRTLGRME